MKKVKIVTHHGRAHRDEYLACCLIMYHTYREGNLCFIERRVTGDADLRNPDTWVVDTGGEYNPVARNFDHHQSDNRLKAKCSLDLVLEHLLPANQMKVFKSSQSWLKVTSMHDNQSAADTAEALQMPLATYISLRSPVEKIMLSMFAELSIVHPDSPLACVMRETGRLMLTEAERLSVDLEDRLSAMPYPFTHAGLRVWDIRPAWQDASDHVELALVNQAASKRSVDVIIGKNLRHGTTGMYRTAWATEKMDMTKLDGMQGVRFTHKNGFYAVLEPDITDTQIMLMLGIASALKEQPDA